MIFRQDHKNLKNLMGLGFAVLLLIIPGSFSYDLGSNQLNIPSEPYIVLLSILVLYLADLSFLISGKFLKHPITLAALGFQGWMICMIPFSSDALVSAKYVLVNAAHFWLFYFGFYFCRQSAGKTLYDWMRVYSFSFFLVMIYTLVQHGSRHFRIDVAPIVSQPFYSDHALMSASAAFLIPFFFIRDKERPFWNLYDLFFVIVASLVIYFSYCRATVLSLLAAFFLYALIKVFKINFRFLLTGIFALFSILTVSVVLILNDHKPNTLETKKINWKDQFKSIANVTTDVSNLERINRYHCAFRMWQARPLTGYGPGTFQTAFLAFQHPEEMTRISVTAERSADGKAHPTGRGGGAHSEYLQALSEMGTLGLVAWLALMFISLFYGLKLYYDKASWVDHQTILAVIFSLTAYFTHALINNFLHDEEISVLFWAALSGLVMMDLDKNPGIVESTL